MKIVVSQSKRLQHISLWMWYTTYASATSAFHKYVEAVIWRLVR